MAENSGMVAAQRFTEDTLMGVFGTPLTTTVNAFDAATETTGLVTNKWYRFIATEDCHVLFAASGNATTSSMFLKAGIPEIFYLGGGLTRVSVIKNTTAGSLFITQMQTNPRA